MILKELYLKFTNTSEYLQSASLLFARLTVAYGFYDPAIKKLSNIEGIAGWFSSIGIPFPLFNAYMAGITEILGVILLSLGLFTRFISIPLIVVMLVAIFTVHYSNGFSAGDNGFEIPFYYMLFLLTFLSHGAGKFSLDKFLFGK